MSEEMECFRKAAELGCPDFEVFDRDEIVALLLRDLRDVNDENPSSIYLPCKESRRINRYAAAVCAEWWAKQNVQPHFAIHQQMIEQARAFGKKFGAQ